MRIKVSSRLASNFGQPEASCNGGQLLTILMCWSALSNYELGSVLVDIGSLNRKGMGQANCARYYQQNAVHACTAWKHYDCTTDQRKVIPKSKVYKDPTGVENGLCGG